MNILWWALEILLHLKCRLILHMLAYMTNGLQLLSFKINQPNMFYLQRISILAYFLCCLYAFQLHYFLLRLATSKYFFDAFFLELGRDFWRSPQSISNLKQVIASVWVGNLRLFLAVSRKTSKDASSKAFLENLL